MRLGGCLQAGLVTFKQSSNNTTITISKRLAAELFCGGHDNGNMKVWMELIHSRLRTKAVVLVQRAVQVHTNQEKMEDDDVNGRSHSGLQRYEDNYAPIKHRKRRRKTSLKFSPSRWAQTLHSSASTTGGDPKVLFDWEILVSSPSVWKMNRLVLPSFGLSFPTIQSTQMEMPKVEQTVISQQTWCSSNNMLVGHVQLRLTAFYVSGGDFLWFCRYDSWV